MTLQSSPGLLGAFRSFPGLSESSQAAHRAAPNGTTADGQHRFDPVYARSSHREQFPAFLSGVSRDRPSEFAR
eukprot:7486663-Alexandrium_andersonii.AAC.1